MYSYGPLRLGVIMRADLVKRDSFITGDATAIKKTSLAINVRPGFLLALLANVIWGASFLASKYTLQAWGPFTASGLRFGIATMALFVFLAITGKKIEIPSSRKQLLTLIVLSTSGFGLLYPMQLAGLKYISSSLSAAIMLTAPLLVLVLGKIVLKENLTTQKWIALALGVFGGSILLSAQNGSQLGSLKSSELIVGSLLTLAAAASLAVSVIATRKLSKDLSTASITLWSMAIGFFELTLAAFVFEENVLAAFTQNASLMSWMAVFFLALVCSAFCFFIWNAALSMSSPQEIASSMHIKTPTAVLIGIFVANESLTLQIFLGMALVMLGVWLSQQKNNIWSKK